MKPSPPMIHLVLQKEFLRKLMLAAAFIGLLGLIAKPVWDGREQWHFGQSGDDGAYWVIAKSLAQGGGYRLASLPGAPYAIHYPPLYPLYLSLAWRWSPAFPQNLKTAALLQALMLPVYLALLLMVLRQLGYSWRRTFLVAALTAVTFQLVMLAITLFSELLFGCLLLAAILAVERSVTAERRTGTWYAVGGGAVAGLAYLTRNAGMPLLAAVPAFYFLRNRRNLTVYFMMSALPLAAGWHAWSWWHSTANADGSNVSYFTEYLRVIRVNGFWASVYQQAGTLSASVAENFFPGILRFLVGLPLHHLVFASAIAGGIRLGRRRHWPLYLLFSALYLVMILCWWYDGLARLMMPAWPMLLAGIAEEARHFASLCEKSLARSSFWSARKLHWQLAPAAALLLAGCLLVARNGHATRNMVAAAMSNEREHHFRDMQTLAWIREHAAPDTVALAWKDTLSYLYTGVPSSHGLFLAVTPQQPGLKALAASFSSLPTQYHKGLLLLLQSDIGGEPGDHSLDPFARKAETLPEARLEYDSSGARVYSFTVRREASMEGY